MSKSKKLVRHTVRDVLRLIQVASDADYLLTPPDALWVWEHHSTTSAAQDWVEQGAYTDEQLLNILKVHLLDRPNV